MGAQKQKVVKRPFFVKLIFGTQLWWIPTNQWYFSLFKQKRIEIMRITHANLTISTLHPTEERSSLEIFPSMPQCFFCVYAKKKVFVKRFFGLFFIFFTYRSRFSRRVFTEISRTLRFFHVDFLTKFHVLVLKFHAHKKRSFSRKGF